MERPDADATDVRVRLFEQGALHGVGRVEVKDNGTGIDVTRVDQSFSALGWSWKKTAATMAAKAQEAVKRWKDEQIYPFEGEPTTAVETVERQVFDIVAGNIDRFLPKFSGTASAVKRLQFRFLRVAIEARPDDLVEFLEQAVNLPEAERRALNDLLQRTSLSNVIKAARIVDDRLRFLGEIERMINDPDLRKNFLEREHLHELLARNTWIFGEAYNLTASDESLTTAVRRHMEEAKIDVVVDDEVRVDDGRTGRLDLMLTRAMGSPGHSREHLVVELKRPTVPGSAEVIKQVKDYARALARDPRWNATSTRWIFWAVVYDLDEFAKDEALRNRDGVLGRILNTDTHSVWLKTWGQVFEDCRSRMQYLKQAFCARRSESRPIGRSESRPPEDGSFYALLI